MIIKLRPVLLVTVCLLITLTAFSSHANETSLLHKAQIQQLITALELKDYIKSLEIIEGLERDGLKITGELLYFHAVSALAVGRSELDMVQSEKYLKESGEQAKYYNAALEVFATATEEYDILLLEESFNDYRLTTLEHLKANKKGSSDQSLYMAQMSRLNVWKQAFQNNHNGLMSTFSVKKNADGTYNLMRLDWLSCPVGTVYEEVGLDAKCEGTPSKIESRNLETFAQNFKFLPKGSTEEMTGWRLPHKAHLKFDSSPTALFPPENLDIKHIRAVGASFSNFGYGYIDGPHRFLWPTTFPKRTNEDVTDLTKPHIRSGESFPCWILVNLHCEPQNSFGNIVLIRGPYTVRANLSAKCAESDLVERGSYYEVETVKNSV